MTYSDEHLVCGDNCGCAGTWAAGAFTARAAREKGGRHVPPPHYASDSVAVTKSWLCPVAPVVIPVATVTLQCTYGFSDCVLAVKTTLAVAPPESLELAIKVVEPHPFVVGVARVPKVKVGIFKLMVSSMAIGTFRLNL